MTVLPEGLQTETSMLLILGRVTLILWAAFLLLAGRRFPRCTAGTFFMGIATALSLGIFSGINYGLALLAAWATFAFCMLVAAFVPRLSMAVACAWPLAAVYLAYLFNAGSFGMNKLLVLGLALAGAALGALFPSLGLAVLAPALGAVLLMTAIPAMAGFWWPVGVFAAGVSWQAVLLPWWNKPRFKGAPPAPPSVAEKRLAWRQSLGRGAAVLAIAALAVTLLVPNLDPKSSPEPKRLVALRKSGALDRPSLMFSPEDAFYLFGRPVPAALVGPWRGPVNRLALPFLGHGMGSDVGRLRAVKDEGELAAMRRAAAVTSKAFEEVAPLIKPGANEADLERAILASFQRNGANGIAFRCVVGSGRNATLPHYMDNNAELKDGLVVIDIGCSVDHYASDMTRTFPVSGKLTDAQRKLVETVIAAGDASRAALKPGARISDLDQAARDVIKKAGFGDYFTHGIGHPVGLDVHDSWIRGPLVPGNVITIEPGIYIPAGSKADRKYWDLGVRVEDSYLVTKDGYEELTHFPRLPQGKAATAPAATPEAGG